MKIIVKINKCNKEGESIIPIGVMSKKCTIIYNNCNGDFKYLCEDHSNGELIYLKDENIIYEYNIETGIIELGKYIKKGDIIICDIIYGMNVIYDQTFIGKYIGTDPELLKLNNAWEYNSGGFIKNSKIHLSIKPDIFSQAQAIIRFANDEEIEEYLNLIK